MASCTKWIQKYDAHHIYAADKIDFNSAMSEEAKFKRVILKYQFTVESKHRDDYAV